MSYFWRKLNALISARKNNNEYLIVGGSLFIVVVLLWAPFDLKTPDISDGWRNLPVMVQHGLIPFMTGPRPLVYLPWKLAALITENSFMGAVILMATLFWAKALLLYTILRKLRLAAPALAFLIAVLFILYPADEGNFLMRALGRHSGVALYLLAILLLIIASQKSNPIYLAGMLLAQGMSALTAEQGYPLMLITPAVLLLNKECPRPRKLIIASAWYFVLLLAVVIYLLAEKPHQDLIFSRGLIDDNLTYAKEIILSNLLAFRQVFIDGWLVAFGKLGDFQWQFYLMALAIVIVAALTIYLLSHVIKEDGSTANTPRFILGLALVSLSIIGLSFFPYSLTQFRYVYSRVFYYAAAGGALVVGLIYATLTERLLHWKKGVNLALWCTTIFIVSYYGLLQHADFARIAQGQQQVLINIIEQAPTVQPQTTIVLISKSPVFTRVDSLLRFALTWLYQRNVDALLCFENEPDPCSIPFAKAIIFKYSINQGPVLQDTVPVEYQQSEGADDYAPYERISYTSFPERAKDAFNIAPDPARVSPGSWIGEEQTLMDRRVCNVSFSGQCSLFFYRDGVLTTTFSQRIQVSGNAHEGLVFSFWVMSAKLIKSAIPIASLTMYYGDGSEDVVIYSGQLSKHWTMHRLALKTNKPYTHLVLQLHPNTDLSSTWLDDLHLSRENLEIAIDNPSFEK